MSRLNARDLKPETRRKLGLKLVEHDELERQAYAILAKIGRYDKEVRWEILHHTLQIDGGEPRPVSLARRIARWAWREMKKGWRLTW